MKEFLSQKGVAFTERNVSNDLEARTALKALGYAATPVTVIGEDKVVGYNRRKIEALLAG